MLRLTRIARWARRTVRGHYADARPKDHDRRRLRL